MQEDPTHEAQCRKWHKKSRPALLPVTEGRGSQGGGGKSGGGGDGDSQMTLRWWSVVPLSPATGQGLGLV